MLLSAILFVHPLSIFWTVWNALNFFLQKWKTKTWLHAWNLLIKKGQRLWELKEIGSVFLGYVGLTVLLFQFPVSRLVVGDAASQVSETRTGEASWVLCTPKLMLFHGILGSPGWFWCPLGFVGLGRAVGITCPVLRHWNDEQMSVWLPLQRERHQHTPKKQYKWQ